MQQLKIIIFGRFLNEWLITKHCHTHLLRMHAPISNSFQREYTKSVYHVIPEKKKMHSFLCFTFEEGRNPFLFKSSKCVRFFS